MQKPVEPKVMQAPLQIFTRQRKKKNGGKEKSCCYNYQKKKNYLHFIKQTLTKIYKTFKSIESVKNVHVKTDEVQIHSLRVKLAMQQMCSDI